MKKQYYDLMTLGEQSFELRQIMSLRKKHSQLLHKKRVALLVIDMQKFFMDERSHAFIPNIVTIIPKIKNLQDYFLSHHLIVIQTRHSNTLEDAGQMKRWYKNVLQIDHPWSEMIPELLHPDIPVLHKTQYDAFWQTDLQKKLQRLGITQLVMTGVMTHLCCETTARSAFVRGFEVFFTIDGTATYNEKFHLGSLLNLSHGFAVPVLCEEVIQWIENITI